MGKQCPTKHSLFMRSADCNSHGCQCKSCQTTFSAPTTTPKTTPKKFCKPTKFRRLSHSQCFFGVNNNPMWQGGGMLPPGQKTRLECQQCCANSPGCVAFEWQSHSMDPNAKAYCAFAWGCERVARWGAGDAFLSNCAHRGVSYPEMDKKGSYAQAQCPATTTTTSTTKACRPSDFMQAGAGSIVPFNVVNQCTSLAFSA